MKISKSTVILLSLTSTLFFLISGCGKNEVKFDNHMPANALRGGGVAYAKLSDLLNKSMTDNDFTKFSNNPDNYEVSIKEDQDSFTYTFFLKSYRGRPVLDGIITFKVNKESWEAVQPPRP